MKGFFYTFMTLKYMFFAFILFLVSCIFIKYDFLRIKYKVIEGSIKEVVIKEIRGSNDCVRNYYSIGFKYKNKKGEIFEIKPLSRENNFEKCGNHYHKRNFPSWILFEYELNDYENNLTISKIKNEGIYEKSILSWVVVYYFLFTTILYVALIIICYHCIEDKDLNQFQERPCIICPLYKIVCKGDRWNYDLQFNLDIKKDLWLFLGYNISDIEMFISKTVGNSMRKNRSYLSYRSDLTIKKLKEFIKNKGE